jgi:uncharacterized protein YjbJ (UPF0337 family)
MTRGIGDLTGRSLHPKEGTRAQLFDEIQSQIGRRKGDRTGEVGDSELRCNSGPRASPPMKKGQREGQGAADASIEGNGREGRALTGEQWRSLLQ